MHVSPQHVIVGWVSCASGRDELVGVTIEVRDQLVAGGMICPACATACKPTFAPHQVSEDIQISSWRDGRWQQAFALR